MQSPLSGLCEVLKEVKRRIEDYKPNSEAQTRTALIDPILVALGWNLSDSKQVELEKHVSSKGASDRLDYFLKCKPPIVVEAKKLGEKLDDYRRQIIFYADSTEANSLFLTNGVEWRHYDNSSASPDQPKSIMNLNEVSRFDLSTIKLESLPEVAAYLVQNLDAALHVPLEKIKHEIPELTPKRIDLECAPSPPWCILTDNSWEPRGNKPRQLWLPGKQIVDVTGWSQVLAKVCEFCLSTNAGLLNPLPILDKAGRKQNLVGLERPANGYAVVEIAGQALYVNTTYDALTSIKNAVYMLEKLGEGTAAKAAVLLAE